MVKELKNMVETTINIKYREVQEISFADMTQAEKIEYREACSKVLALQDRLYNLLTKEQLKVLDECFSSEVSVNALEQHYMFDHGFKAGLNELGGI